VADAGERRDALLRDQDGVFLANCRDKQAVLGTALRDPAQRGTALRLLLILDDDIRKPLFPTLVALAAVGHRDISLCREVILLMPRDWVIENIEIYSYEILKEGGEEEYRRLAELFYNLDRRLLSHLIERALESNDAGIREVGEEFFQKLSPEALCD
jgi:hypothetical protein